MNEDESVNVRSNFSFLLFPFFGHFFALNRLPPRMYKYILFEEQEQKNCFKSMKISLSTDR